jgi:phage-related protein
MPRGWIAVSQWYGSGHRQKPVGFRNSSELRYREHLIALHGFIKKARTTPDEDLALARKRKQELEQ